MELKYIVKNEINIRKVLKEQLGISDRFLTKLKKYKHIYRNGDNNVYLDMKVNYQDTICVDLDFEEDNSNIISTKINLDIIYEDEGLLIVNKPPYIPVHPSLNYYENSLSNGVKYYYDSINLKRKIRPINRLDKDTSGIVIFAKNEYIQYRLKNYSKEYIALVNGKLLEDGIINKPISRKQTSIIERCININGEKAITEYKVLKNLQLEEKDLTLLKCILHTGRTHQIRVHMSSINHPILGDTLYGNSSKFINRQALHAYKVKFIHPIMRKELQIVAPIPNDINNLLHS